MVYIYSSGLDKLKDFLIPKMKSFVDAQKLWKIEPCLWQSAHYLHAEYRHDQIIETFDPYTLCFVFHQVFIGR